MAQELDFENEGLNGERCARDLKHLPYIHVPAIYWDKTSKVSFFLKNLTFNPWGAELICKTHRNQRFFFHFEIIINALYFCKGF